MKLFDWVRRGSRLRRAILLFLYTIIPILIVGVAARYTMQIVAHPSRSVPEADRLARVGDILMIATLALALVAGLVALQAYAAATGQPKLQLKIHFADQRNNEVIFESNEVKNRFYVRAEHGKVIANIWIRNRSSFSAKNPAVVVRLSSMARDWTIAVASPGWEQIEFEESRDIRDMQWDGGAEFSIHGDSVRRLPDLSFNGLYHSNSRDKQEMYFELLAEGYRRSVPITVTFLGDSPRHENMHKPTAPREWV